MVSVFIAHLSNYADFTWRSGFLAFFQYYLRVGLRGVMLPPRSRGWRSEAAGPGAPFAPPSTLLPYSLLSLFGSWTLDLKSLVQAVSVD